YLRRRFDNKVGITACLIYFVLSQTLGAVGIYSAAIAVSTMLTIPLVYTNIGIGLFGTTYTALGGFRSVVWADCIQAIIMIAAPITIIANVINDSRAVSPPLTAISEFNVTKYLISNHVDMTTDDNMWTMLLAGSPYALVRAGFDQMAVQRFMAARTLSEARWIAVAGTLFVVAFFASVGFAALALVYWYRDCDPLVYGAITSYDQIVPYYLKESLSDVNMLRGLFLAGLLSASTSTVSSVVNTHAATFYFDVVAPFFKMNDRKSAVLMRLLGFYVPVLLRLRSFRGAYTSSNIIAMGEREGSGLGLLDISVTLAQVDSSLFESSGVFPLYQLSFFWMSFIGAVFTIVLGTVFSLATGDSTTPRKNLHLISGCFLKIWRRVGCLRRKLQLQENVRKTDTTGGDDPVDDEHTALGSELQAITGAQAEEMHFVQ
ncbi:hypothetical protein V5799_019434, partial [Amblyomma americanum]